MSYEMDDLRCKANSLLLEMGHLADAICISLKAELDSAIADRDRWERNSAAENKRAGDLEIKLRQVEAERDRARKAEGLINADHDAEIRRKALKEAAEVFENGVYEVWGSRPAAQAILALIDAPKEGDAP